MELPICYFPRLFSQARCPKPRLPYSRTFCFFLLPSTMRPLLLTRCRLSQIGREMNSGISPPPLGTRILICFCSPSKLRPPKRFSRRPHYDALIQWSLPFSPYLLRPELKGGGSGHFRIPRGTLLGLLPFLWIRLFFGTSLCFSPRSEEWTHAIGLSPLGTFRSPFF